MSQILSGYLRQELITALNNQYGSVITENATVSAAISASIQTLSSAVAIAVNRYLVSNVTVTATDLQITGTIAKTDVSGSVTNEPVSITIDPNPHNHRLNAP